MSRPPGDDLYTEVQLLGAATSALGPIYKAHKWFLTRGDLDYTSLPPKDSAQLNLRELCSLFR